MIYNNFFLTALDIFLHVRHQLKFWHWIFLFFISCNLDLFILLHLFTHLVYVLRYYLLISWKFAIKSTVLLRMLILLGNSFVSLHFLLLRLFLNYLRFGCYFLLLFVYFFMHFSCLNLWIYFSCFLINFMNIVLNYFLISGQLRFCSIVFLNLLFWLSFFIYNKTLNLFIILILVLRLFLGLVSKTLRNRIVFEFRICLNALTFFWQYFLLLLLLFF